MLDLYNDPGIYIVENKGEVLRHPNRDDGDGVPRRLDSGSISPFRWPQNPQPLLIHLPVHCGRIFQLVLSVYLYELLIWSNHLTVWLYAVALISLVLCRRTYRGRGGSDIGCCVMVVYDHSDELSILLSLVCFYVNLVTSAGPLSFL